MRLFKYLPILLSIIAIVPLEATARDTVPCPSVATVRSAAQAIDTAEMYTPQGYDVASSKVAFRESNIDWKIKVYAIHANSDSEAIRRAQESVSKIIVRLHQETSSEDNKYGCVYYRVINYPIIVSGERS